MLVTKTAKPSPTSQSCRQHISSPTSVTNIDVVDIIIWKYYLKFQVCTRQVEKNVVEVKLSVKEKDVVEQAQKQ